MPASPQAIDAYKTYLYRKGNKTVSQIESIKPGQPIDLTDLDAEIAAVMKTIIFCETVSLPTYEEQHKLKGLVGLKKQLVGQTWPTMDEIKDEVKKAQMTEALGKALALAKAQAELQQAKAANKPAVPKWKQPLYKPLPKSLGNPTQFVVKMPLEQIQQEWIMRLGIAPQRRSR